MMRETYTVSTHGLLAVMLRTLTYRRGKDGENTRLVLVGWIIYLLPHTVSEQLDQIFNMELPDACACAFRTPWPGGLRCVPRHDRGYAEAAHFHWHLAGEGR